MIQLDTYVNQTNITMSQLNFISENKQVTREVETGYYDESGSLEGNPTPWSLFLVSMLSCQGVLLSQYLGEHRIELTEDIKLSLKCQLAENGSDVDHFLVHIHFPDVFPPEAQAGAVAAMKNCKVARHISELTPTIKYLIK